jgi:CBS domain-containing protein
MTAWVGSPAAHSVSADTGAPICPMQRTCAVRYASGLIFDEEAAMQIREVMTPTVHTVNPHTQVSEIARLMRDEDIGAVPVAENDRLVGMVTDRDIVLRAVAVGDGLDKIARDVMSPQILYCREDQDVDEVLKNMAEQQIRRLPVVNRDKRLVGVVSLGDLSGKAPAARAGGTLRDISKPASH